MRFESLKCDECQRIQDGANHWLKMAVHYVNTEPVMLALGDVNEKTLLGRQFESGSSMVNTDIHDLCGQGCAVKHLAKLLGWSQVLNLTKAEGEQ